MGIARAGVGGVSGLQNQPTAQIIDGSLRFDSNKTQILKRTPGSAGNKKIFTWSAWLKRSSNLGAYNGLFFAGDSATNLAGIDFTNNDQVRYTATSTLNDVYTSAKFRDTVTGWYHIVFAVDVTQGTNANKVKIYVNGVQVTRFGATNYPSDSNQTINDTVEHLIGKRTNATEYFDGYMSQVYLIDGQQLDASYFGFTDPLTNNWKPKKYDGTFGTNGFYLPMDGNSPIGQDKSGNGNDWMPVNFDFGNSAAVDKATGALPILQGSGAFANAIVRTDANASTLVLALPLIRDAKDVSNQINSGSTAKTVTVNNTVPNSSYFNFYGGSYYFDGNNDWLGIGASTDFTFGTGSFTMEGWFYPVSNGGNRAMLGNVWSGSGAMFLCYSHPSVGTGKFGLFDSDYSGGSPLITTSNTYAINKWYHVAFVRNGTSHKIYVNGVEDASVTNTASNISKDVFAVGSISNSTGSEVFDGYIQDVRVYKGLAKYTSDFIPASPTPDIVSDSPSGVSGSSKLAKVTEGAVEFNGPTDGASVATGYLSIPAANTSDFNFGTGDFTWEGYFYGSDWTGGSSNDDQYVVNHEPTAGDDGSGLFVDGGQSYYYSNKSSSRFIITGPILENKRWYHIAAVRASGTLTMYVNGISVGSASYSDTYSDAIFTLGRNENNNKNQFRGFISNFRVLNSALYTSNFTPPAAPLTNVTNTKLLCCQSKTSSTEAAVTPGAIVANGDTPASTFNPFNTDIKTVRGLETGYATFNQLKEKFLNASGGSVTLTNGNRTVQGNSSSSGSNVAGTLGASSGKFYIEYTILAKADTNDTCGFGIRKNLYDGIFNGWNQEEFRGTRDRGSDNGYYPDATSETFSKTVEVNDIVGIAFDIEGNYLQITLNGLIMSSSTSAALNGYTWFPYFASDGGGKVELNSGQIPYKFTPPDGYKPLNTANIRPETVISRPDQYVGVATYTGNGSTKTISGLNHKPDLVWLKSRTAGGGSFNNHVMVDSVRGTTGSGLYPHGYRNLYPNLTDSEYAPTDVSNSSVTSLNSNRFDIGGNANTNYNTATYVAWAWKAGGNKNTFNVDDIGYATAAAARLGASGNSWDSDPTGASIGTKQGFSIIKHTGTGSTGTLPHGLTQKPTFYISKPASVTGNWVVYTDVIDGSLDYLYLNTTDAKGNSGQSLPTSELFSYGYTANEYIHYLWHDVPGLQKFGSFTGNESTDGPYVELGFEPAVLIIKNASGDHAAGANWFIFDGTRDSDNPVRLNLNPNDNSIEEDDTSGTLDFLSNGFKIRSNGTHPNGSGNTIIYAAWAKAPSIDLYGGGANAR